MKKKKRRGDDEDTDEKKEKRRTKRKMFLESCVALGLEYEIQDCRVSGVSEGERGQRGKHPFPPFRRNTAIS